jgi:hypothetical protein
MQQQQQQRQQSVGQQVGNGQALHAIMQQIPQFLPPMHQAVGPPSSLPMNLQGSAVRQKPPTGDDQNDPLFMQKDRHCQARSCLRLPQTCLRGQREDEDEELTKARRMSLLPSGGKDRTGIYSKHYKNSDNKIEHGFIL